MLPLTQQDSRKMSKSGSTSKLRLWLGLVLAAAFIFVVVKYWDAEGERVSLKEDTVRQQIQMKALKDKFAKITEEAETAKAEQNELRGSLDECQKRSGKARAGSDELIKGMQVEIESLRRALKTTEQLASEHNVTLVQEKNKTIVLEAKLLSLEQAVANNTQKETAAAASLSAAKKELSDKGKKILFLSEQIDELKAATANTVHKGVQPVTSRKRYEEEEDEVPTPKPKQKQVAQKLERAVKSEVHHLQGEEVLSPISRTIEKGRAKELEKEKEEHLDKILREQIENLGTNATAKPVLQTNGTLSVNVTTNATSSKLDKNVKTGSETTAKVDTTLQKFLQRETATKKFVAKAKEEDSEEAEASGLTSGSGEAASEEGSAEETLSPPSRKSRRRNEPRNEAHEL